MKDLPLEGRVALVTGVSRRIGIGFAVADRLASMGADLFVHSFVLFDEGNPWGADRAGIGPLLEELRAHGRRVEHIDADFADPEAPRRVMEAAVQAYGHVDILVANHAYYGSGNGSLEDLTAQDIDKTMQVNVRGSLLLVKEFAAQHDGRPGGRVVLFTSGQHLGPMPGELAYIASKGALHQLTASLSAHLIPRGITVNTVNPGGTDTGWATGDLYDAIRARHPQGRWGQPEDAARLVAWLATDDACWITGQVINSTGGG
ncbi:MAG TPA: SDR family oxidoreductase [Chloroflexia bacterium]|nr:SDR family oxidoreductase [Chloroflexia bacterium]